MVFGPNDPDTKVHNGDILDIEDDVITTSQESSPTVQLGGGVHGVGAARRNSSLPTPTDELSSLRELDKDLRAPKPDGSRRGSYDESYPLMLTHHPPAMTPPANLLINMVGMDEPRRSMAGTFTVNTYAHEDSLLALRENMEFGQGRLRQSRRSSNMSNWSDSAQSLLAPSRMRPSVKRDTRGYLGTPAEENRASLVHAVPLYVNTPETNLMSGVSREAASTGTFSRSSNHTYESIRHSISTGAKTHFSPLELSPTTSSDRTDSHQLSAIGGNRRHSEPLASVVENLMETASLPTSMELPELPVQRPRTLSKKPALPQIQSQKVPRLEKLPSIEDTFDEEEILADYLVFPTTPSDLPKDKYTVENRPMMDHATDSRPIGYLVSDSRFLDAQSVKIDVLDNQVTNEVILSTQPRNNHHVKIKSTGENNAEEEAIRVNSVLGSPAMRQSVIDSNVIEGSTNGDQPIGFDVINDLLTESAPPIVHRVTSHQPIAGHSVDASLMKHYTQESGQNLSVSDQPMKSQDVKFQPIESQTLDFQPIESLVEDSKLDGHRAESEQKFHHGVADSQLVKLQVVDGQPIGGILKDPVKHHSIPHSLTAGQLTEGNNAFKNPPKDVTPNSLWQHHKSTSVHFGEQMQLEGQLAGRYYHQLDDYLDFAVTLALTDMIKIHTYNGALLKTGSLSLSSVNLNVIYVHLADQKMSSSGYADACCQCYLVEALDISLTTPLQDLSVLSWSPATHTHSDPYAADQAIQCDVMSAREKESSGLTPTMQIKPEVTAYVTGETTSRSVSCSLSHPPSSPTRGVAPLLDEFVASHVKKLTEKRLAVSPEILSKLKSILMSRLVPALKIMVSSTGKMVTNEQMVNWLNVSNMLNTADTCLSDLVSVAMQAYRHHYALNVDFVPLPHLVGRRRGMYHMSAYEMVSPKVESDRGSRGYSKQWQTTPYDKQLSRRVDDNVLSFALDNYQGVKKLLVGPTKKDTSKVTTPDGHSPFASPAKPAEWKGAAKKAMKLKRLLLSALAKRRLTFLHQLLENLSEDEQHLLHLMFAAANPSGSGYISVIEVCLLLSAATGSKFSVPNCRKIIAEIDLDGDGQLSLIDVLSVLYLTDLYLLALADGFRTPKVAELSQSFTASHALVYIALSQLCHAKKLKLNEEDNILIKIANVESAECGETYVDQSQLPKTSTPALFSMSFLGRSNTFLDQMAVRLMDSTRIRMGQRWSPSQFVVPVHKKTGNGLIYPILDSHLSFYPKAPYMVKKNTALARQPIPPIHFKGENINFDPLSVYSNAGIDMFHRKKSTSYGIEERSHRPAGIIAMREIRNLASKALKIANLFLETSLFNSRKYRELVAVFKSNQLKLWPADIVRTSLAHPPHGTTIGRAEGKVKDMSLDIYHVLTRLRGALADPPHTDTEHMLQ